VGRDSDGTFMMLDGQRTSVPAELSDVELSPDGSRLCRTLKSPAGVWFTEGERTSPVFPVQSAGVSFSPTGATINVFVAQANGAHQSWSGNELTALRRSRTAELSGIFWKQWVHRMGVDPNLASFTLGDDGYSIAWVERDGRQLRWRRYQWPPTHVTKIDMASREPGLREARDAVLSALKDRSVDRLLAYVDPDIHAGFGDPCCGVGHFRSIYNLDDRSSPFWEQARRVIEDGGILTSFRGTLTFTAPYTFNLPIHELGPLLGGDDIGFVTGDGTKLRAEPRPDSTVLRTFDWEPAAYLQFGNANQGNADLEKRWVRVRTLDGHEGYIEQGNFASAFDLRASFAKRNGRWIITAFDSGD
jgi:hypothetical protein